MPPQERTLDNNKVTGKKPFDFGYMKETKAAKATRNGVKNKQQNTYTTIQYSCAVQ